MIIHFWQLPAQRTYALLDKEFNVCLYSKIITLDKKTIKQYLPLHYLKKIREHIKLKIDILIKISALLNDSTYSLKVFEKHIVWIGSTYGNGIHLPLFPFKFSCRSGARFLAAIMNDGCITQNSKNGQKYSYGSLLYDNHDFALITSVRKDAQIVLGDCTDTIRYEDKDRRRYLRFLSVVRDIIFFIFQFKGKKSELDVCIPNLIFERQENMLGWIEQTIADEGDVKNDPSTYRRSVVWRRSLDVTRYFQGNVIKEASIRQLPFSVQQKLSEIHCRLIDGELEILRRLHIKFRIYNLGIYLTKEGKIKTRFQITITRKENLVKLDQLLTIPSPVKEKKLNLIAQHLTRNK